MIPELAGDTSYSLSEFATEISRQAGRSIPYVDLSEADYRDALAKAGLPLATSPPQGIRGSDTC